MSSKGSANSCGAPTAYTQGVPAIGGVRIAKAKIGEFFVPHRTALITLCIERQQSDRTFRFSSLSMAAENLTLLAIENLTLR
ncbi:MAG: hypothetical protein OXI71_03765, partial [Gemmatimonadota bacterium]|nr:hypothetical protein [Gemmatimonadota bacterium]